MFAHNKKRLSFENFKAIVKGYEYIFLLKLWGICILIFSFMCIIISLGSEYNLKQLNHSLRENYDNIFFTTHRYHSNYFFHVGNSMDLFNNNGYKLQCEVLMQSEKLFIMNIVLVGTQGLYLLTKLLFQKI